MSDFQDRFLVRLSPIGCESLSSWRQRSGLANDYALYPIPRGTLRRVDPDGGSNPIDIDWLAKCCNLARDQITAMSMAALANRVFHPTVGVGHPAWILRARYSRKDAASGPVYCAHCLATDKQPYFRLEWRVGLITECPIHAVELDEKCPHCGAGIWPHGATRSDLFRDKRIPMGHCHFCRRPLADVAVRRCNPEPALALKGILHRDLHRLAPAMEVPTLEVFGALDAFCRLFLRRRARARIVSSGGAWSEIVNAVGETPAGPRVDYLSLAQRRLLVHATLGLLAEWPKAFLRFAEDTGITQEHFSGAGRHHPPWLESVIHENLRRQNRGVSNDDVVRTIAALRADSATVTKASVQIALGSQASAIHQLLSRRDKATDCELAHVLDHFEADNDGTTGVRSVRIARCRDHAIFMFAMLRRQSFTKVCAASVAEIGAFVASLDVDGVDGSLERVRRLLSKRWLTYELLAERISPGGLEEGLLHAARGGTPERSAQRRMRIAMAGLDKRLARSVSVFWDLGSASTTDRTQAVQCEGQINS